MKHALCIILISTLIAAVANAERIVVVTENFEPYSYMEYGQMTGLSTDVVTATLQKAGMAYQIAEYPWPRSYKMALKDKNVLIYSIGRNEQREPLFKWIGPIVPPIRIGLFKLKDRKDIVIQSLEDAKKYDIGVMRDSADYQLLFSRGFKNGENLDVISTTKLNIKKLFTKRFDLIACPELWLLKTASQSGFPPERLEMAFIFMELDLYMAFSRHTADMIVDSVAAAFEKLKEDGLLQELELKYRQKYPSISF
ncbi:MAG: transporter substrate-binding domain-containing protein [Proteobacteria bacterium]|nr:transporter substrate-binding domain-containing protein [Pseudomonadota bacterium]